MITYLYVYFKKEKILRSLLFSKQFQTSLEFNLHKSMLIINTNLRNIIIQNKEVRRWIEGVVVVLPTGTMF
jgi:hypothetical protein